MLGKKQSGKGGTREPGAQTSGPAGPRCARAVAPCAALLSLVAVASCLYLGVKTNDLQVRIAALEAAHTGDPAFRALPKAYLEELNAMVHEKVERLLAQVGEAGGSWRVASRFRGGFVGTGQVSALFPLPTWSCPACKAVVAPRGICALFALSLTLVPLAVAHACT